MMLRYWIPRVHTSVLSSKDIGIGRRVRCCYGLFHVIVSCSVPNLLLHLFAKCRTKSSFR